MSGMGNRIATSQVGSQPGTPGAAPDIPLILGGHSFINQLGNDLPATEKEQCAIVETCLNCGIRWIDTTYQPERIALGGILHRLGRRAETSLLAWSFFKDFTSTEPVGEPEYYHPGHIDIILEQLRTDHVDCLVVIPAKDSNHDRQQIELAMEWRNKGYARSLGLWAENLSGSDIERYREKTFRYAVFPVNVTTRSAAATLAACKRIGLETLATSPFVRGWELERMVADASARNYDNRDALLRRLADLMLRFSLFHPNVDRLIVGMRRVDWIGRNLESVSRGPLLPEERRWLRRLYAQAERRHWWQRIRRRLARSLNL
jgi:aryl-alcohol dehydrogenase-like predicted oxidoreductase